MWDPLILSIDEIVHGVKRVWPSGVERGGLTEGAHKIVGLGFYILHLIAVHCSNMLPTVQQNCTAFSSILRSA